MNKRFALKGPFIILFGFALAFIMALTLLFWGSNNSDNKNESSQFDIFFTCDVDGRIEPCGCFSGQMGGLTKIKTMINKSQTENQLIFDIGDAIAGQEDYHVIQYDYMMKAFQSINFNALNIGHREALLPLSSLNKLKQLSNEKSLPILSANLRTKVNQKTIFEPFTIINKNNKKIGVIGLVSPNLNQSTLDENIQIQEPRLALAEFISELDKKVDVIILLGFLSNQEMIQIADEFYEVDFILGGNVNESSQQLEKRNQSWIYYTTNEGRTLGQISFQLNPKINILSQHISLAYENIYNNEEIKKLSNDYRNAVRNTSLSVDRLNNSANAIPGVTNLNYYVGSEKCSTCHEAEYNIWKTTSHGHAFKSLQDKNSDADPSCIKCHTIGFGTESGYQRAFKAEKLINVGCENCHGPAGIHVDEFKSNSKRVFKFNQVTADDCTKCHYGEFSRPFNFNTSWPKVKHGKNTNK